MPATIKAASYSKKSFFADATAVLGSNLTVIVLAFLSGVVLSRSLGPDGQGVVQGILIYPILIINTAEMGIRQATVLFTGAKLFPDKDLVESLLFLAFCSSIIGMCLCFFVTTFSGNSQFTPLLILLATLYIPIQLTNSYVSAFFLGKEQISLFANINWLADFSRLSLLIVLIVICKFGVTGALISTLVGSLLVAGYSLWLLSRKVRLSVHFHREVVSRLIKIGVAYAISLLVLQLNYNIGVIIMNQMDLNADVGFYSVGASWAIMLWQLPNALGLVLFTRRANSTDDAGFIAKVGRLFRVTIIIVALSSVVIFLVADPLIPLIYGDRFRPCINVLRAMLPGVVAFTLFRILNMDIAGKGKPWLSLFCTIPSLLFSVVANLFLLPNYGALGAAIATSVSFTVGSFIMVVVYCHVMRMPYRELARFSRDDFKVIIERRKRDKA